MLKYMLDTNICSFAMKRKPLDVKRRFNQSVGQMCISTVTYAELIFGAERVSSQRYLDDVERFCSGLIVVDFDPGAAIQYASIRADLEKRGELIGGNDLFIAAHARSRGFILVTNNVGEFSRVDGLRIEDWSQ